jgi:hypothetical protein
MAEQRLDGRPHKPLLNHEEQEKLKQQFDVTNFDVNAILRGAQLTVVGGENETRVYSKT